MNALALSYAAQATRWQGWSLGIGLIAALVVTIGGLFDPSQFLRAYLVAYVFVFDAVLGSLALLMIYHLTGGAWGFLIRRILEAATRLVPLMALLFLPIGLGSSHLYTLSSPEMLADDPRQRFYFATSFFWARAALYFVIWWGTAWLLKSWSRAWEQTGDVAVRRKLSYLSGAGLVGYGIALHFASADWLMSIQAKFHSTIFGPLIAAGQVLTALAVALVVLAWLANRSSLAEVISMPALIDLGSLLFAFLVIWAYMNWFEFMLIWIADLPHENIWYLPRLEGAWYVATVLVVALHFMVPFFLLLLRAVKGNVKRLGCVAAWLLLMQWGFLYQLITPHFQVLRFGEHWMGPVMPLALGGVCLACFLWQLRLRPLLARNDPSERSAQHLRHVAEEAEAAGEVLAP